MNFFTLLVVLAVIGTAFALIGGIISMAVGHDVGHRSSAQWMNLRVAFQGAALLFILLAVLIAQ